jgi:hypothetical protein
MQLLIMTKLLDFKVVNFQFIHSNLKIIFLFLVFKLFNLQLQFFAKKDSF